MLHIGFEEFRDIGWKMLPIGVKRDSIGETHFQSPLETALQGVAFTLIVGILDKGDAFYTMKDVGCSISAAVIDHDDIVTHLQCLANDAPDGPAVVIRRDNDADAAVVQQLFLPYDLIAVRHVFYT